MIQEPASLNPAPTEPPASPAGSGRGRPPAWSSAMRAVFAIVVCLVVAVPVVIAFASAPAPITSAAGASAEPTAATNATTEPSKGPGDKDGHKDRANGRVGGFLGGGPGKNGHGKVTITAINGSALSLATDDGWKRTITVTTDTTITKGDTTITVGDLDVGDEVRFLQKRNDDGTYTITRIVVPTPKTGGEVTAVSGDRITIKQRDGSSQVITVTSATTYTLGREKGSKSDVVVGVDIAAAGSVDGTTFMALSVHVAPAQAGGVVTAITKDTITVQRRGQTDTTVIHVSGSTTVKVKGKDPAAITDIKVGDRVQAAGKHRSDGSLDASTVQARGPKGDKQRDKKPESSESAPTG